MVVHKTKDEQFARFGLYVAAQIIVVAHGARFGKEERLRSGVFPFFNRIVGSPHWK